jgi:hypothetical protein
MTHQLKTYCPETINIYKAQWVVSRFSVFAGSVLVFSVLMGEIAKSYFKGECT